jgi:hypothetical protein
MAISRVGSERKLRRRSRCQLVVGLVFAAQASGQQAAPVLQLQIDNDLIAIRGAGPPPDYDYTHGSHLAFSWSDQSLVLAQEIYTPRHNEPSPVAGDRPYAASLFGGYAYRKLAGSSLGTFALRAGVTGAVFYDGFIEQSPRNAAVPGARKRTWVGEAAVGIGCRTNRFTAEYRHVVRGREYEAEPSAHAYGSITVSLISP